MGRGTYIAMLGIDGAGKSSVTAGLREHLERGGHEVVDASTETMFARARAGVGHPWESLDHIAAEGWRLYLDQPARQSGIAASGLLELVAHFLIRADVVAPAIERGAVVVCDSFCLKNIIRTLRQVQQMDGGLGAAVEPTLSGIRSTLASPYFQPDIGLLLDADPHLALRWRTAQHGRPEPGADLAVAGRAGGDSFVELQTALAAEYRAIAADWGWRTLPVDGRPLSETIADAITLVTAYIDEH